MATSKSAEAIRRQIEAMGTRVFEVGLFDPDAVGQATMLSRIWDPDTLLRSVPWMRFQNWNGRNIYLRPKGEHNLSLVDDLTAESVAAMKRAGYSPALVVQTSPRNHQAWLKHRDTLNRELGTAVARKLAEKFGGDRGAADWRHYGRAAGFVNRKRKHLDETTGLYPFVILAEATGKVYPEAERFVADVAAELDRKREERRRLIERARGWNAEGDREPRKTIDSFRADPRYGGDGNRVDLAYAVYAISHGVALSDVRAAVSSRNLAHKGNERRQADYVERTLKKALVALDHHVSREGGRGR